MEPEVVVTCQVPIDWKEKIDRLATERKKEPQQVIYEALAQYLGEDANTTDKKFLALETEITTLQREQTELTITVKNLQQRLQAAASLISISDPVLSSRIVPSIPKVSSVNTEPDEDDYEDEPDEILYDFLPPELR